MKLWDRERKVRKNLRHPLYAYEVRLLSCFCKAQQCSIIYFFVSHELHTHSVLVMNRIQDFMFINDDRTGKLNRHALKDAMPFELLLQLVKFVKAPSLKWNLKEAAFSTLSIQIQSGQAFDILLIFKQSFGNLAVRVFCFAKRFTSYDERGEPN